MTEEGSRDDEYRYGQPRQRVGSTGPFKEKELAGLLKLRGRLSVELEREQLTNKDKAKREAADSGRRIFPFILLE